MTLFMKDKVTKIKPCFLQARGTGCPFNFNMNNIKIIIRVYETDKYIGSIPLKNLFNTNLCDKEIELLRNEIKEYVKKYKEN